MTPEERQRQMDFIVEHQARFVARFEHDERRLERLETIVRWVVRAGLRERRETRGKINALIESQEGMVQAQHRTDERLNVLVGVVERQISSGGNGKRTPARKQAGKKASKKGGKK